MNANDVRQKKGGENKVTWRACTIYRHTDNAEDGQASLGSVQRRKRCTDRAGNATVHQKMERGGGDWRLPPQSAGLCQTIVKSVISKMTLHKWPLVHCAALPVFPYILLLLLFSSCCWGCRLVSANYCSFV